MAATSFPTTEPLVLARRSMKEFAYTLQMMRLTGLLGTAEDSIIHMNTDLTRSASDTIKFSGGYPLSGAGVGDDGNTTNAEEAMGQRNDLVVVHERSHSVVSAGPMSQQRMEDYRTIEQFRAKADRDLAIWRAETMEKDILCALAGLYNENSSSSSIETINEVEPTASRIWFGGQSIGSSAALGNSGADYGTDALLTAGTRTNNLFGRLVIEKINSLMRACTPRMRPGLFMQPDPAAEGTTAYPIPGGLVGNFFVALIGPNSWMNLRQDSQFSDMYANAEARGSLHPMFTGGNILWDGTLGIMYDRIPTRTGANGTTLAEGFALNAGRTATTDACANTRSVERNIFLAAQAALFAWAMTPTFSEDMVDTNKPKVKTTAIYGVKTANFNSPGTSTPLGEEGRYLVDCEY